MRTTAAARQCRARGEGYMAIPEADPASVVVRHPATDEPDQRQGYFPPSVGLLRSPRNGSSSFSETSNCAGSADHVAAHEEIHMCGIVAAVSRGGGVSQDALQRATRRLHHRGPDAQRRLGRAARPRRARPRAPEHHRPGDRRSADRQRGRAAPHRRQRRVLRLRADPRASSSARGHAFRTQSDSEIALHLYEDAGPRVAPPLRGEFAFAIWDERDGAAVRRARPLRHQAALLRDPRRHALPRLRGEGALRARRAARWDRETLYDVHFVAHAARPHAVRRRLPAPAGQLPADRRRARARRAVLGLGLPARPTRRQSPTNRASTSSAFAHALEEAVRLRLRADVPVACYLSGGIDSCAVLGLASRLSREPLRAYTLSFDHAEYDESAHRARSRRARPARSSAASTSARSTSPDHFADAIYHAERPS